MAYSKTSGAAPKNLKNPRRTLGCGPVDKLIHRATSKVVLLDCLSGWVSKHLLGCEMLSEGDLSTVIHKAVDKLVDNLVQSTVDVIVVTSQMTTTRGGGLNHVLRRWQIVRSNA